MNMKNYSTYRRVLNAVLKNLSKEECTCARILRIENKGKNKGKRTKLCGMWYPDTGPEIECLGLRPSCFGPDYDKWGDFLCDVIENVLGYIDDPIKMIADKFGYKWYRPKGNKNKIQGIVYKRFCADQLIGSSIEEDVYKKYDLSDSYSPSDDLYIRINHERNIKKTEKRKRFIAKEEGDTRSNLGIGSFYSISDSGEVLHESIYVREIHEMDIKKNGRKKSYIQKGVA
jgi:hypothetical protein